MHPLKEYPWHQRVIRVFDPDGHIIEVGESMESVACREFAVGFTAEETAKRIEHPVELVRRWYENYREKQRTAKSEK